jgi:hypothetical protein
MSEAPAGMVDFINQPPPQSGASGDIPPGLADFVAPEIKEEKFGTLAQQAMTFAESAAKGATFGLSTGLQTALGASPSNILARQEVNPVLAATGEMTGLVGSAFIPGGEGALIAKAGELGAAKLIPKAVTTFEKLGSAAAKGVIENAMVSGGDELSKAFAHDPDQTVETAITNVGLGAAIGGALGGAFGAVSPLWDATVGPKASAFLSSIRDRAEGKTLPLSDDLKTVLTGLEKSGVEVSPEMIAGLSEHPMAAEHFQALRESGNDPGMALRGTIDKFKDDVGEQLKAAVRPTEGLTAFEAGEKAKADFLSQAKVLDERVDAAYAPLRESEKNIMIPDEDKIKASRELIEMGSNFGAKASPEVQTFDRFAHRLNAQNSLNDVKQLITELNNEWATFGINKNTKNALNEIRGFLRNFEDKQVEGAFRRFAKETSEAEHAIISQNKDLAGVGSAARKQRDTLIEEGAAVRAQALAEHSAMADAMIAERKAARDQYAHFMDTLGEMSGAGKLGKIRSIADLEEALKDLPSAKLADRLFDKKNIEGLRMLQEKYPDALRAIVDQKKAHIVEAATTKGDLMHNKLLNQVNSLPKEVRDIMFTKEQQGMINSAGAILRKTGERMGPSGTPVTLDTLWKHAPAGILGAVSMLTGHNPMVGMVLGQAGRYLSREAPDTVKLSLLKFLGSSGPVDSGAWKAAADFIHASQKGQSLIENSVKNVFKAGREVLPQSIIPSEKDTKRLDKKVGEYSQDPMKMMDMGGKTAHYLPEQASSLSKSASTAVNYLSSIKPHPPQGSAFDSKQEVSKADQAAYDRQLQIAEQPLMVLHHMKSGELQPSDVVAVKTMYPSLYNKLSEQIMSNIVDIKTDEEPLPYKTRLSMAMFMGQPLDGTMQPQNIQAAQGSGMISHAQSEQGQQMPQQKRGAMAKLGKSNELYATPGQSREMAKHGKA